MNAKERKRKEDARLAELPPSKLHVLIFLVSALTVFATETAYPSDGDDAATLMKNLDVAMYAAKEAGRDGWRFFSGQ